MLNIWRLQLLVQLYNLKKMRLVAEKMMISPASVSSQLKLLEEETNTILFEKHGRNVQLTTAGIKLVQQVQPILDQLEKVNNNFQYGSERIHGSVRIASFDSAIKPIIIPAIASVRKQYPQIEITITEQDPVQSIPALNARQFDLALIAKYGDDQLDGLTSNNQLVKIGSDHLKVLVSNQNELAHLKTASVTQLKDQNWIIEPPDAYTSQYINKFCVSLHIDPKIWGILRSYSSLQLSVSKNLAIGFLPELAINVTMMKNITTIDFSPKTERSIYLLKRKNQSDIPAVQIVAQAIQKQAQLFDPSFSSYE